MTVSFFLCCLPEILALAVHLMNTIRAANGL